MTITRLDETTTRLDETTTRHDETRRRDRTPQDTAGLHQHRQDMTRNETRRDGMATRRDDERRGWAGLGWQAGD
jgi:hypothetical protein